MLVLCCVSNSVTVFHIILSSKAFICWDRYDRWYWTDISYSLYLGTIVGGQKQNPSIGQDRFTYNTRCSLLAAMSISAVGTRYCYAPFDRSCIYRSKYNRCYISCYWLTDEEMICYWMMALDIQLCNLSDKAVSKGLFYRSMSYQLVLYHVLVLI